MADKGKHPADADEVTELFRKVDIDDAKEATSFGDAIAKAKAQFEELLGDTWENLEEQGVEMKVNVELCNPQPICWDSYEQVERRITSPPTSSKLPLALASSFKYKPLPPGYFRLLTIVGPGDFPVGQMEAFSLDAAPEYVAMSYSWGKNTTSRTFFCNNQTFAVSSEVLDALNSLGLGLRTTKVWIDAICINQADEEEKANQVAEMQRIYARATRVAIWLGPAEDNSDIFIDKMDDFVQWAVHFDSNKVDQRGQLTSPPHGRLFLALGPILARPWFNRVWVVQEVLLAKDAVLVCGTRFLDWKIFCMMIVLTKAQNLTNLLISPHFSISQLEVAISNILNLGWTGDKAQKGLSPREFTLFLNSGRLRKVTEPVDRVWGFLGLADPELRKAAMPLISYSSESRRDFYKTYVDMGRLLLLRDPELCLLSIAASTNKPPGMPSWCPNFHTAGLNGLPLPDRPKFRFHAGIRRNEIGKPEVKFGHDPNTLMLRGFRLDKVDKIAKMDFSRPNSWEEERLQTAPQENLALWDQQCLAIARSVFRPIFTDMPDAHARTMLMDSMADEPQRSVRKAYANFQKFINNFDKKYPAGFTADELAAVLRIQADVNGASPRAYFSTVGGRVGLGPRNIVSGDTVCIVRGAKVPYVMRFKSGGGSSCKFLGDAYVDGVMYGEAMKTGVQSEVFSIS
jgi:hypothetical protein